MNTLLVNGTPSGSIPADDPGLYMGLTVFETMRTYGPHVFRMSQHLDRMAMSAASLNIPLPPREVIAREVLDHLGVDVRIRYTVTAGGNRILDVSPLEPTIPRRTMRVASVHWEPPSWLPGVVKHGSRASWIVAAQHFGVDEVLLIDGQGHILEANRSNVFAVIDGRIVTPPFDGRFLEGVTRGALVEAVRAAGLPFAEESFVTTSPFEELYLSSTLKGLSPVVEIDGRPGPGGGPLGDALWAAFLELVQRESHDRMPPASS